MKPYIYIILQVVVLFFASVATYAQDHEVIDVSSSAVPFLRLSPDARAGGMANMGVATQADASSIFYNLAKTPFAADPKALSVNYTPWLKEIGSQMYMATLSGYHQLAGGNQAFAVGLRYFNLGEVALRDYNGADMQSTHPNELSLEAGYARKLTDRFGVSITGRYIHSALFKGSANGGSSKAGNAVAADVAVFYKGTDETGKGLSAGLVLSNLGSRISYDSESGRKNFIPANLGLGATYSTRYMDVHGIDLTAEINKSLVPVLSSPEAVAVQEYYDRTVISSWGKALGESSYAFSLGTEYTYKEQVSIRAGFLTQSAAMGDASFITTGIGARWEWLGINLSYLIPTGEKNILTNTVRFGIQLTPKKNK